MKQKIIQEVPISAIEVKTILTKLKKEGELNFRAQKTLDHLQQVVSLDAKKAKELEEKLANLKISRMREQHIKKLVDVMPIDEKDAKVIMSGFNVTFNNNDLKTIVNTIKDYVME